MFFTNDTTSNLILYLTHTVHRFCEALMFLQTEIWKMWFCAYRNINAANLFIKDANCF